MCKCIQQIGKKNTAGPPNIGTQDEASCHWNENPEIVGDLRCYTVIQGWYYGMIICAMVKSRYIGDGHPTFNRNPYNGYINPTIGLMTIPYYMEIMGV